ncbi:MAG: hypothetical protein CK549_07020 [Cyanobium sp. Baikal-G2]|nr:MAG: hypothetical protein CK549_07020 [Cyanobium sp. Baikal-G2]
MPQHRWTGIDSNLGIKSHLSWCGGLSVDNIAFVTPSAFASWLRAAARQTFCHGCVVEIKVAQSVLLSTDTAGTWLQLLIISGFGRLSDSELTLAFVGPGDLQLIRIPAGCAACLEALTSVVWGDSPEVCGLGDDLIGDWMLRLLRLRSHFQADRRLQSLFQGLIWQHGCRIGQGYWLPFPLSHERLAELIGSTRPTATRALQQLRQSGQLWDHPDQPGWLFRPEFLTLA